MTQSKKAVIFFVLFIISFASYSQEIAMGVKGGLNYSVNQKAAEITGSEGVFTTNSQLGYQAGVFLQWEFNNFFVRPEANYFLTKGEFLFPNTSSSYSITKLSFPLLIGYRISDNLSIFAGPAYQQVLDSDLEKVEEAVLNQQRNLAAQLGIMFEYDRLQIDLRYDFTFNSPKTQKLNIPEVMDNALFDDGRLNQFMLSFSYKVFDPGLPEGLKTKKRNCYF